MAVSEVVTIAQGPLLGTLFTMLLYGVILMQISFYVRNYPRDRGIIKIAVTTIWVLETLHTALSIEAVEYYLIRNFNNPAALSSTVWSMELTLILGFVIAYFVNVCFVWRIYLLSEKIWITAFLGLASTARVAIGLSNCSMSFKYMQWKIFREHVYPTMIAGWTVSVFVDCSIAATICYYLHTHRTGMQRTDTIINRLLVYTVNTGAITSVFAILVIITFTTISALAFLAFVQVQSKLCAISLLATLNSRRSISNSADCTTATFNNFHSMHTPHLDLSENSAEYHMQHLKQMRPLEIAQNMEMFTVLHSRECAKEVDSYINNGDIAV